MVAPVSPATKSGARSARRYPRTQPSIGGCYFVAAGPASAVLGGEAHHLEVDRQHLLRVTGVGRPVPVAHDVPGRGAALGEEGVVQLCGGAGVVAVDRR